MKHLKFKPVFTLTLIANILTLPLQARGDICSTNPNDKGMIRVTRKGELTKIAYCETDTDCVVYGVYSQKQLKKERIRLHKNAAHVVLDSIPLEAGIALGGTVLVIAAGGAQAMSNPNISPYASRIPGAQLFTKLGPAAPFLGALAAGTPQMVILAPILLLGPLATGSAVFFHENFDTRNDDEKWHDDNGSGIASYLQSAQAISGKFLNEYAVGKYCVKVHSMKEYREELGKALRYLPSQVPFKNR